MNAEVSRISSWKKLLSLEAAQNCKHGCNFIEQSNSNYFVHSGRAIISIISIHYGKRGCERSADFGHNNNFLVVDYMNTFKTSTLASISRASKKHVLLIKF